MAVWIVPLLVAMKAVRSCWQKDDRVNFPLCAKWGARKGGKCGDGSENRGLFREMQFPARPSKNKRSVFGVEAVAFAPSQSAVFSS